MVTRDKDSQGMILIRECASCNYLFAEYDCWRRNEQRWQCARCGNYDYHERMISDQEYEKKLEEEADTPVKRWVLDHS